MLKIKLLYFLYQSALYSAITNHSAKLSIAFLSVWNLLAWACALCMPEVVAVLGSYQHLELGFCTNRKDCVPLDSFQ